jgi:TolA-binding protein
MKSSKKIIFFLLTAPILSLASEPSAFGAGDLTSSQPYGLTSNEKVILETKQKLKKVAQKSNYQENKLDSLRERIDGLQSIVESLSRKAHNNKISLQKLATKNEQGLQNSNAYEERLAQQIQDNSVKIETLKEAVKELSKVVDDINLHYVTKEEYNTLVHDVNDFKALVAKELQSSSKKTSSLSGAELAKQAKSYYDKRYYTKAIAAYEELIRRNYRPAYAHYMIGEMYYKRKDYGKAISFYKKSSKLYSKASYMPRLMYHTAIAMNKTGDKEHAKLFFKALVKKYPNSPEAKEAKKYIE